MALAQCLPFFLYVSANLGSRMHFLYEDSLRERVLESALHIGAAEGDEAISVESVAKLAELSAAQVLAEFPDREAIVRAIPEYVTDRKVKFLEETLDADPGYADLFTKLTTFTEAYYEYAEREPELFRYLFEKKAYVFEDEWQALLQGNLSYNRTLDLIYESISLIAAEEKSRLEAMCVSNRWQSSVLLPWPLFMAWRTSVFSAYCGTNTRWCGASTCARYARRSSERCSRRRSR